VTYFLENIAQSLYNEFGNTLNRHCLVFPNRRAGLYFLKYLAAGIDKPVWTPAIITINELFRLYSRLQIADNEILLFELYKVYRRINKSPESFDNFYFWGDMLINDFDDIDKYMVDASILFSHVQDIKNIEQQFGGLTEEQVDIIKRFWINFDQDKPTREKSGFLSIWSILNNLYSEYRSSLRSQNLAYEGMIFRDLAERSLQEKNIEIGWDKVHFIGFNALNNCEKAVMSQFKNSGKARFYWDYDNSYITGNKLNSAGFFLRQNLKIFGNDMPPDWCFDTLLSSRPGSVHRQIIDTSSDVAQVKLISQLIEKFPDISVDNAHHTAVILADENLLIPALTSLPENIKDVNITMGYPLRQTQVYSLVKDLILLQKNARVENGLIYFSYRDVISILKNRFISGLMNEEDSKIINGIFNEKLFWISINRFTQSENLKMVFSRTESPALLSEYLRNILSDISLMEEKDQGSSRESPVQRNILNEFIYRILLSINRLETISHNPDISLTKDTYIRILDKILRNQSVPFSGEPLSGIQIMGILETRALDFKNLIILSVNEGILPGGSTGPSFIPFSLREAFDLPTINHQESIYAYHFYRLLQRAENVVFIYNSNSEGLRSGEMSRFLLQMKYEPAIRPDFVNLRFEIKTHIAIDEIIERTEDHNLQLKSLFLDKNRVSFLSPTAINTWLNCRMRFYYRYVNRLKEAEKITSDIDPAMFGTLLHNIMKNLYSGLIGQPLNQTILKSIISDHKKLEDVTNAAINDNFKNCRNDLLSGNELIVKEVLIAYVLKIIEVDCSIVPLTVLSLEKPFSFSLSTGTCSGNFEIMTGGNIDRVDMAAGVVRIVDYKTGAVSKKINAIDDLFNDKRKKESDGWLQTLHYCEAYIVNHPGSNVRPSIYKIKELPGDRLSDRLRLKGNKSTDFIVEDYSIVRDEFMSGLRKTIENIFSNDEPFIMTRDLRKCDYCPYKTLCMR
jgi:hypothetical protein